VEAIPTDHEATECPVGALAYLLDAEALCNSARAMKELAGRVVGVMGGGCRSWGSGLPCHWLHVANS